MPNNNTDRRKRSNIEKIKSSKEAICCNCGCSENVEWHHIVPVCVGGRDVESNIIPLCHACHMALHHGRNATEYLRSEGRFSRGRNSINDDKTAYAILDKFADGLIGTSECKKLLGLKSGSHITDMPQYKRWREKRGYSVVRNNIDTITRFGQENLTDGKEVGYVIRNSGRKKTIYYHCPDGKSDGKVRSSRSSKLNETVIKHNNVTSRRTSPEERKNAEAWWAAYKKEHYSEIAMG